MSVNRYALGALALMLATSPATAQYGDHTFDSVAAQALFDEYAAQFPALNATVMRGGEIIWEAEGGNNAGPADSVETDYNFYSIAKMLTGMAYARLEQEAGLDLDQSVRAIDPELPDAYEDVTLRQLLSHTGGVRHYRSEADWIGFADRRCETPADALGHFIDDRLASRPGRRNHYTTFGFALLSHLLLRITGTADFDAAMHAVLGEHYRVRTDHDAADKAVAYIEAGGETVVFSGLNAQCKFGGGGLIGSSRDLARMGSAFAAGDIVDRERLPGLFEPFVTTQGEDVTYVYGMGTGYSEAMQTHYALHSGGSPGGRGFLAVFTDYEISVALTANFDGPRLPDAAIGLARLAAGLPLDDEGE